MTDGWRRWSAPESLSYGEDYCVRRTGCRKGQRSRESNPIHRQYSKCDELMGKRLAPWRNSTQSVSRHRSQQSRLIEYDSTIHSIHAVFRFKSKGLFPFRWSGIRHSLSCHRTITHHQLEVARCCKRNDLMLAPSAQAIIIQLKSAHDTSSHLFIFPLACAISSCHPSPQRKSLSKCRVSPAHHGHRSCLSCRLFRCPWYQNECPCRPRSPFQCGTQCRLCCLPVWTHFRPSIHLARRC
jgi:hypothetical protein